GAVGCPAGAERFEADGECSAGAGSGGGRGGLEGGGAGDGGVGGVGGHGGLGGQGSPAEEYAVGGERHDGEAENARVHLALLGELHQKDDRMCASAAPAASPFLRVDLEVWRGEPE